MSLPASGTLFWVLPAALFLGQIEDGCNVKKALRRNPRLPSAVEHMNSGTCMSQVLLWSAASGVGCPSRLSTWSSGQARLAVVTHGHVEVAVSAPHSRTVSIGHWAEGNSSHWMWPMGRSLETTVGWQPFLGQTQSFRIPKRFFPQ